MSLLLDALRRAEQAKQQAESAPKAATPLSLEDRDAVAGQEPPAEPAPAPQGADAAAPPEPVDAGVPGEMQEEGERTGQFTGLSLEPREGERPELDLEEFRQRLADTPAPGAAPSGGEAPVAESLGPEDAHTMPSLKSVRASLRDFYAESGAHRRVATQELPKPEAADTQSSRRAARNVFAAKRPPRKPARTALWLGVGGVAVAALVAGGYWVWVSLTSIRPVATRPQAPALASRLPAPAAQPVPAVQPAAPPVAVATLPPAAVAPAPPPPPAPAEVAAAPAALPAAAAQPPAASVVPALPQASPTAGPEPAAPAVSAAPAAALLPAPLAPAPAGVGALPAAAPPAPPAQPPAAPVSEPQEYALARAVQPPPAPRQVEPAPRPAAPEPPVEAEVPPMQVTRRPEADPLFRQIERAYLAYQDGDLGRAQALYRGVLARDPRNRDALLGMAAVALQAGRPQEAQQAYLRILQVNPRDRAAQAALGALQGGADPRQGESRLKGLLAEEPGAAYLHFNLGNLYAAQSRWAEAQDAYFNAFRLDSRNPDYAFNLAVSLDHLGKARPALDHYELALDLAGERRPRFDRGVVASRVQSLRERVSAPLP